MKEIALLSEKLPLSTYIITAISIILGFSVAAYLNIELYLLLSVVGVGLLWIMLHYPKIWIYCIAIGCVLFFDDDEKGVSSIDIFAAMFFNIFLIVWFVSKLLIKSERHITNNHFTLKIDKLSEKLFLLFYCLLFFNSIIAVANGIDITNWFREFMLFTIMLYYFPIRDYFNDKRSIIILLILFALVTIRFDIRQFLMFYKLMSNVSMAWEIGSTDWKINQGFYSAVIMTGITMFLYTKNKLGKLFSYILVLITTFTLISTFARAYWISVAGLIGLLSVLYCRPRQFLQLLLVVLLTAGILFACLDSFFPKQSKYVQEFITHKLSSSTKGKSDPSVEARLREFEVVYSEIKETPLYGQGFRKEFSFFYNVKGYNVRPSFIHNGYLNLAHKTGIPMMLLFYSIMVLFNIKGYIVAWRLKRCCNDTENIRHLYKEEYNFFTALVISASLTITMLLITNMVTSSLFTRDGLILIAFSTAFITIAERKYNEIRKF